MERNVGVEAAYRFRLFVGVVLPTRCPTEGRNVTFIATIATPKYTLQVSDRMLSTPAGEFDALANKAMIIGTRRGIVSLAFSGTAFTRDRPTDQRIAEQITGMELDQNAVSLGGSKVAPSLGFVIRALIDYLYDAQEWRAHRSELVMVGWQWKIRRGRLHTPTYRHVLFSLRSTATTGPLQTWQHVPRHWPDRNGVASYVAGTNPFSDAELQRYRAQLAPNLPTSDEAEQVLVRMVRDAAARRPDVIGENCMAIMLPAEAPWDPRVRYDAANEPTAVWLASGDRVPVRYTPWVIHGGVASGPKVVMGVRTVQSNGITVDVSAPNPGLRLPGDQPGTFVYPTGATQGLDRPLPNGRRILSRDAGLFGAPG